MANKRVTIKDIANHLGVSYGVINKAINNKSGISDAMKKKILDAAEELGYRVNKVAQCMARSTITIGVVIATEPPEYYSAVKTAMDREFERLLDYNVECGYYPVKNVNAVREISSAFKKCVDDGVHGIVMCFAPPFGLGKILDELKDSNIKVTIIGHPNVESERILCSVHTDAFRSGTMAAHMMALMVPLKSNIIVFVDNKNDPEHAIKVDGFMSFSTPVEHLDIVGVYETLDNYDIMNEILARVDSEYEQIRGIYCTNANSVAACEYVGRKKADIKIVGTDINHLSAKYIKNGIMDCAIFQDIESQAVTAVKAMYEYLAENKTPDENILISPQIVISSNIDGYYKDESDGAK